MAETSITFFSLPAELRNEIYEYHVDFDTVYLLADGSFCPPSIARASKQVREEFLSLWEGGMSHLPIRTIHARVDNLDLDPLLDFLELRDYPEGGISLLYVKLVFTDPWEFSESGLAVIRWAKYFEKDDEDDEDDEDKENKETCLHRQCAGYTAEFVDGDLELYDAMWSETLGWTFSEEIDEIAIAMDGAMIARKRQIARDAKEKEEKGQVASGSDEGVDGQRRKRKLEHDGVEDRSTKKPRDDKATG